MKAHNLFTGFNYPKYPILPIHNGYPAWSCKQENIEEACIADYVWREYAANPEKVEGALYKLFKNPRRKDGRVFLYPHNNNITVSLCTESCGCYTYQMTHQICRINSTDNSAKLIAEQEKLSWSAGFTLEGLFANTFGWKTGSVARHLAMHGIVKIPTMKERQLYSKKTMHHPILMAQSDRDGVEHAAQEAFPTHFGFAPHDFYPYFSEDGRIACYKVSYLNPDGQETFLVFSKYQDIYGATHFDSINWAWPKLPYNYTHYCTTPENEGIAIICTKESMVWEIYNTDRHFYNLVAFISYLDKDDTFWHPLRNKTIYIVPENSRNSYKEAVMLGSFLKKKISPTTFYVPREEELTLPQNVWKYTTKDTPNKISFSEFCLHAKTKYSIEPPAGILPVAEPLFSDKYKSAPQPLQIIPGILNEGDSIMLHAYRGVGKSLFAIFLALHLALGKNAWGDKIAPKRPYNVLFLDAEMTGAAVYNRAKKIAKAHGLDISAGLQLNMIYFRDRLTSDNLENEEFIKILAPDFKKADLVIVDGAFRLLPSCMSPNFNDSEPLQVFVQYMRKLGKTLLIIDHQGKSKADSFGSMGKELKLDGVLKMSQKDTKINIEISKMRDNVSGTVWAAYVIDPTPEEIKFLSIDENDEYDDDGEHEDKKRQRRSSKERRMEIVAKYCQDFPKLSQKDLCQMIMAEYPECGGRSSISKAIRDFRANAA